MHREILISQIEIKFPVTPVPPISKVLDSSVNADSLEIRALVNFFDGRRWNTITADEVFMFRFALSAMSPIGIAYYAPAFLTASVKKPDSVDTAIEDMIFTLGRADPSLWNSEQTKCICVWIQLFQNSALDARVQEARENLGC